MFKKVALLAVAAVLMASAAFGSEIVISNQFPPSHHNSKALEIFAEKINEMSGGKIQASVAHSGALYSDAQVLQAVQDGLVPMALIPVYRWGGMIPAAEVFDLPFLFVDLSSPEKFLNGGADAILDAEFGKKGVKNIFWCDYGFIQMWNNEKPIHGPEDLKGLTMRCFSAGDSLTLQALGAAPTLISSSETYMALQNGTVRGTTTGMPAAVSRKFYEVVKYLTICNYSTAQFAVQANLEWWEEQDEETQKIILEAGKIAEAALRASIASSEEAAEKTVREAGLIVNALTPEERAKMVEATRGLWDDFVKRAGEPGAKLVEVAHKCFD